MATSVSDTFTDTAGTALTSHTGEIGATWVAHPSNASSFAVTNANRIRQNAAGLAYVYASGTPASADYDVTAVVRKLGGSIGTAATLGIMGRLNTAALTGYYVQYNDGAAQWQMGRLVGAANTSLGTYAQALTLNQDYTVVLRMQGTAISVYIDTVLRIGPVTDANIAPVGTAAVRCGGNATVATDSTGYHLDTFTAADIPAAGGGGAQNMLMMGVG